jgi:hypothetical protein
MLLTQAAPQLLRMCFFSRHVLRQSQCERQASHRYGSGRKLMMVLQHADAVHQLAGHGLMLEHPRGTKA